jgi:hypothetical protein
MRSLRDPVVTSGGFGTISSQRGRDRSEVLSNSFAWQTLSLAALALNTLFQDVPEHDTNVLARARMGEGERERERGAERRGVRVASHQHCLEPATETHVPCNVTGADATSDAGAGGCGWRCGAPGSRRKPRRARVRAGAERARAVRARGSVLFIYIYIYMYLPLRRAPPWLRGPLPAGALGPTAVGLEEASLRRVGARASRCHVSRAGWRTTARCCRRYLCQREWEHVGWSHQQR